MIIAPKNFRDEEFFEPKQIFEQNNLEVTVFSKGVDIAVSALNKTETAIDGDYKNLDAANFDAVVFIGGGGASIYCQDPTAHQIAQKAFAKNKIIAAICIAPWILAEAGILKDKEVTAFKTAKEAIEKNGGTFTGSDVEIDGNIITANGPAAATKFGKTIIEKLKT